MKLRLRLMQIILLIPCCIIDFLSLLIIHIPMYITCGIKPNEKEPFLQWLFELKEKEE